METHFGARLWEVSGGKEGNKSHHTDEKAGIGASRSASMMRKLAVMWHSWLVFCFDGAGVHKILEVLLADPLVAAGQNHPG